MKQFFSLLAWLNFIAFVWVLLFNETVQQLGVGAVGAFFIFFIIAVASTETGRKNERES